jgi:hypothetical protein
MPMYRVRVQRTDWLEYNIKADSSDEIRMMHDDDEHAIDAMGTLVHQTEGDSEITSIQEIK